MHNLKNKKLFQRLNSFLVYLIFCLIPLNQNILAQELQEIPVMNAWVIDQANALTNQQIQDLNRNLEDFKKRKGSQIAVVIVSTTKPEPIEDYSIRLAEKWKVGREKIDDGVILVIAKDDRKLRIEVGYGIEAVIPDAKAKQIIEEQIVPHFKSGNFHAGILAGVSSIQTLIEGGELPGPSDPSTIKDSGTNWVQTAFVILFVCLFGSSAMGWKSRSIFSAAVSIAYFLLAIFLFDVLWLASLLLSIFIFFLMMIGGFILSLTSGGSGSSSGGSYSSGSSGFSSSSSSSFSGGGGGSFGGGGSSGSW